MGISEIELLDDDGSPDAGSGAHAPDGARGGGDRPNGSGPGSGWTAPHRVPWPPTPAAALLAVVVTVVAALSLAVATGSATGGRFDLSVVSASYSSSPDETGVTLQVSVRNLGSAMVELTDLAVAQPGLVPSGTNGGFMQAGLPVAVPPEQTVSVPLVFNFDCRITAEPAPATTARASGYDTRGIARSQKLSLPPSADPWSIGGETRPSFCAIPAPKSDLQVAYGGIGDTLMQLTPVRFVYSLLLTAPAARSITVAGITHDNPGIAASFDPPLPLTVLDGQTVRETVTWQVMSCVLAKDGASGDGLEVMASNPREAENWLAPLGAQFARDITADIDAVCQGNASGG